MRIVRPFLLIVLIGAAWVFGQQDPFTLSVDVNLVALDVSVSDSGGRPVTTLTVDDFQVYEDGKPQEIRNFASVDTPYSVLMLFDCSRSTEPSWPFLVDAMKGFTHNLRPQDGIEVAQFGRGFKKLLNWSARTSSELEIAVDTDDESCAGTDFYGAIERGLEELRARKGRKGAVVLTDGVHDKMTYQRITAAGLFTARFIDSVDDNAFQKVLRSVRASEVALYFVAVDTDLNPGGSGSANVVPGTTLLIPSGGYNATEIYNKQQARSRMEQLAEASGGRIAFPKQPQDLIPLYERIAHELGTSYGIGYTPANTAKDGKYRKIEVRVRGRNFEVRQSRDGYEAK